MRLIVLIGCLLVVGCASSSDPTTAQQEKITATQAVINERVRTGKMTAAEGQLVMANMKAEMDSERRRNRAIAISGSDGGTYQPVGGGTVVKY